MSKINRGVYQKLKEENKRLIHDLFILTSDDINFEDRQDVRWKWRCKFREEKEFNKLLQEACLQYLKEHPEYDLKKQMEDGSDLRAPK